MDDQLYKIHVAFDNGGGAGEELAFSFTPLPTGSRMNVNPRFLTHLFSQADANSKTYFHCNCIKQARTASGKSLDEMFVNYYIVLFTRVADGVKRGVMIAYDEEKHGLVNAAWPPSFRDEIVRNPPSLIEAIHDLTVHPAAYENVNILSVA